MDKNFFKKVFIFAGLYAVTLGIIFSPYFLRPTESVHSYNTLRNIIIFFATVLLTKYFIYMLVSPLYDVWAVRFDKVFREKIKEYEPKVSVVVPAWNEAVGIISTIESILANTYNKIEIIVVDDGSTDGTGKLVKNFIRQYELKKSVFSEKTIIYYRKRNGGKGRALNSGVRKSTGEILISIDADCYVSPNALENFVRYFADPSIMAVVGNVKIGNTERLLGMIQYIEYLFSFYFKKADSLLNTIYIIGGAAGAFRQEVFKKIGLYRADNLTEDIELSVRIQAAGMRIVYAADAVIYTEGAGDIKGLMKQRLRWKRGRFQTFNEHRSLFFSPRKRHNKLLTFTILPLALFGELQLFLEVMFVIFLYVYSYLVKDYSSFISGIIVVSSMFFVQFSNEKTKINRAYFYLAAPIGWLLFYVSSIVEYYALVSSIWLTLTKKETKWQKWKRQGVSVATNK